MWFISCGDILEFLNESDWHQFYEHISEYEVVLQEMSVKELLTIIQHYGSHHTTY